MLAHCRAAHSHRHSRERGNPWSGILLAKELSICTTQGDLSEDHSREVKRLMNQHAELPRSLAAKKKAPRRTQAERREETKRRILDAATQILSTKGYAGFRISEVASLAQVSRGAQTHHYPTKDSLLLAALEEIYTQTREQSLARIAALQPEGDIIAAMMEDALPFFMGPHFSMALSLINVGEDNIELNRELRRLSLENRRHLDQAWAKALVKRGVPEETAEVILSSIFCLYRGLAVRQLIHSDSEHIQKVSDFWYNMLKDQLQKALPDAL